MKRAAVLLSILALAPAALGADLTIEGPDLVAPYRIVRLKAGGVPDKAGLIWRVRSADPRNGVDWATRQNVKNPEWVAPPGMYRVELTCATMGADGQLSLDTAEKTVTIGDPVPPGPLPPPTPPGPTPPGPTPGPAPIPAPGFRVLFVTESADLTRLPAAQAQIFTGAEVRAYLNAKCAVGSDGVTKEWRAWDKDQPTGAEAKHWRDAMARPRTALPWMIISTGTAGYEGPLPKTVADTLALLKRYGG